MQTVNFQCGHCGSLMAVGTEFLGQQVRCPHCQQVVVAPAPESPPAPPPGPGDLAGMTFHPPAAHEDIFAPHEDSEDLFGRSEAPRLEIPTTGPIPMEPLTVNGLAAGPAPLTEPPGPPRDLGNEFVPQPPSGPAPADGPAGESTATVPSWMEAGTAPEPAGGPPAEALPAVAAPRPVRRESGGGWFLALVFIPLISYSVLATITAAILYTKLKQQPPSPFEMMPDTNGDAPGAKKRSAASLEYGDVLATVPVPAHLRRRLGQPIRLGDLEVTPLSVERKKVRVIVKDKRPEPCEDDSLVLHLRLRNVSPDVVFTPVDNYFDRRWRPGTGPRPLTQLEVGPRHFYGGPADWYPLDRPTKEAQDRQWVEGRKDTYPPLQPGEEAETFVCTDGGDPEWNPHVMRAVEAYKGTLLWRVQLRRGLVQVGGRQLPATAVIGVEFTRDQIKKANEDNEQADS